MIATSLSCDKPEAFQRSDKSWIEPDRQPI